MKQIEEDLANGYTYISFTDLHLDYRSMPLGRKLAVTGFYRSTGRSPGQYETLAETFLPGALEVILITNTASRAARERMLTCRNYPDARSMICPMTVLGRISKCDVTFLGNRVSTDNVCLVVENARGSIGKP
jgi:hypothetical protein